MAENKLPFPIALEKNTNRESTAFGKYPMTHAPFPVYRGLKCP